MSKETKPLSTEKPDEPVIEIPSSTKEEDDFSTSYETDTMFAATDDTLADVESIPWDNPEEAKASPYEKGKAIMQNLRKKTLAGKSVTWFDQHPGVEIRQQPWRKCKQVPKPALKNPHRGAGDQLTTMGESACSTLSGMCLRPRRNVGLSSEATSSRTGSSSTYDESKSWSKRRKSFSSRGETVTTGRSTSRTESTTTGRALVMLPISSSSTSDRRPKKVKKTKK